MCGTYATADVVVALVYNHPYYKSDGVDVLGVFWRVVTHHFIRFDYILHQLVRARAVHKTASERVA